MLTKMTAQARLTASTYGRTCLPKNRHGRVRPSPVVVIGSPFGVSWWCMDEREALLKIAFWHRQMLDHEPLGFSLDVVQQVGRARRGRQRFFTGHESNDGTDNFI